MLTSGGDAPGMNAAVRAVTRGALARGWQAFGVKNGYAGLLADAIKPLAARDVGGIIQSGGTVLGSARCPEFAQPAGRKQALENLGKKGVDALVVAGGVGANRLLRERLARETARRGAKVFYPRIEFCTDNAAMIAVAGMARLKAGAHEPPAIRARATWSLKELGPLADSLVVS